MESTEECEVRLQQLRANQQQRISLESTEEREAHLHQVRVDQRLRRATESAEEREVRIQQLHVEQQERLRHETLEEREARHARDRQNHMQLQTPELPLFQQPHVRTKMTQFHSRLGDSSGDMP